MPNCMGVYLLIVRKGGSSHSNPSYIDSFIQKNGSNSWCSLFAFSGCENFKYGQCCPAMMLKCWCAGIAYSICEIFRKGAGPPQGGCLADDQESRFQAANHSNMGNAVLYGSRLANSQESHFQAVKRIDMSIAILQEAIYADAQELRFEAVKR